MTTQRIERLVNRPGLTVVIPTLGTRGELLLRAIRSASRFECIVVDDATPDDSVASAAAMTGAKYLRLETNRGVAGAQNAGLEAVETEWVMFLHSDDQLSELVTVPSEPLTVDVVQGNLGANEDACFIPSEADLLRLRFGVHISHYQFRTCLARSVGGFNAELRAWEDWDFLFRINRLHPTVHANGATQTIVNHTAPGRLSHSPAMADGFRHLYDLHIADVERDRYVHALWTFKISRNCWLGGRHAESRRWLLRSLLLEPWHPKRAYRFLGHR